MGGRGIARQRAGRGRSDIAGQRGRQ